MEADARVEVAKYGATRIRIRRRRRSRRRQGRRRSMRLVYFFTVP
jgi:hypothetical protein